MLGIHCHHGAPVSLICDQETEFMKVGNVYVGCRSLSKMMPSPDDDWEKYLDSVIFATKLKYKSPRHNQHQSI